MRGDFRTLKVWQCSIELSKTLYFITKKFPKEELFGLTSQIKRAANSVSANIAEGNQRTTNADFSRFLNIALSSLVEVESHLELSVALGFVDTQEIEQILQIIIEIRKMIIGLDKSLK